MLGELVALDVMRHETLGFLVVLGKLLHLHLLLLLFVDVALLVGVVRAHPLIGDLLVDSLLHFEDRATAPFLLWSLRLLERFFLAQLISVTPRILPLLLICHTDSEQCPLGHGPDCRDGGATTLKVGGRNT